MAPGTAGTVAAIPLYLALAPLPAALSLLTITAFTLLAVYASQEAEVIFGRKDAPCIVIDEWAGLLWTMLFIPPTLVTVLSGVALFRCFDIVKPFPVRFLQDRLPGGYGVVMDDVAAGIYANIILHLLTRGGIVS